MHDRRLNGETLSFGHAGILYQNSFVMYDRQTESLWVHVTGRAKYGVYQGKELKFLPSTVTTWRDWKRDYPKSLVLPGPRRGGFMGSYTAINQSFFGGSDPMGLKLMVLFKTKLYPYNKLEKEPVVNDQFNGEKIVVIYSDQSKTAMAWNRKLGEKSLTFKPSSQKDKQGNFLLQDAETKSLWSWTTGTAVQGKLKGKELDQLIYHPIRVDRYPNFYPEGKIY